jgi:hypothetical protein
MPNDIARSVVEVREWLRAPARSRAGRNRWSSIVRGVERDCCHHDPDAAGLMGPAALDSSELESYGLPGPETLDHDLRQRRPLTDALNPEADNEIGRKLVESGHQIGRFPGLL